MSNYVDRKGLIWQDGGPETDDHLIHGGHETHLIEIARGMLPEGGVFVDVGAHVGLYTLNLADKAGVVFSVEANPQTYAVLRQNINANKGGLKAEIIPMNFAAWDRHEYLSLVDENGKETGGSTRCEPSEFGGKTYGCPLDTILSGDRFDLVKIDVEGAEARVLKGMARILVDFRPRLLIEMHDHYFGEKIRIDTLAILEALGYHWNDSLKFGGSYYIVAHPETVDDFVVETVRAGQ